MGHRRALAPALVLAALFLAALALGACDSSSTESADSGPALDDRTVTVGSYDFAESRLLAELYSQSMEARGVRVQRAYSLGPREFVAPALAAGLVEFVPEYAGTALQFATLGAGVPVASPAVTHDALRHTFAPRDVTVLEAAPAQDTNAFVVRRGVAQRYGLRRLSDLAAVAPRLVFGGPPECLGRRLCLRGLEDVYGVKFKEFVRLDAGGPLTHSALDDHVVDVALLFSTDPALQKSDVVALEDDRALQPSENVTPLVRTRVLERAGPGLRIAVDSVSQRLTTDALRDLNGQVSNDSADVSAVASRWLHAEGLT
jgi:osmoprotectant transport system substrate-binding protein